MALEELLQEIRPKYLRPKHFIRVKGAKMSEQEKDEFDAVSHVYFSTSSARAHRYHVGCELLC